MARQPTPPGDRTGRLLERIRGLGRRSHSWRFVRRVIVAVTGGAVLLTGLLMLVLPGPALVVIPSGLAILALEFRWAARLLREVRRRIDEAGSRLAAPASRVSGRPAAEGSRPSASDGPP